MVDQKMEGGNETRSACRGEGNEICLVTHLWVQEIYRQRNAKADHGIDDVVLVADRLDGDRRDHSDDKVPAAATATR